MAIFFDYDTTMKEPLLHLPKAHGLYHPDNEKENCGVGFIAHIKGKSSHAITTDALEMLTRMDHRGGCGCEANTGDGAGILTNIPHEFFAKEIKKLFNVDVEKGAYSVGNVFLPQDDKQRIHCMSLMEASIINEGQTLIGWRDTPIDTDKADVGNIAKTSQPIIKQLIIAKADDIDTLDFERALFVIRKHVSHNIRTDASLSQARCFMFVACPPLSLFIKACSWALKCLTFIRIYQTQNIQPIWRWCILAFQPILSRLGQAQPCRYMSHNGEINTRQGNFNWMHAREAYWKAIYLKRIWPKHCQSLKPKSLTQGVLTMC
ncbi:Glutamate synthase [NADPH] large chain (EC [uncultured Gammaproteobacteria bacterium]|nr:Glutamate synthase [NADPH] large chain (EC [uncultured Gammaproteobacteria bacterium]